MTKKRRLCLVGGAALAGMFLAVALALHSLGVRLVWPCATGRLVVDGVGVELPLFEMKLPGAVPALLAHASRGKPASKIYGDWVIVGADKLYVPNRPDCVELPLGLRLLKLNGEGGVDLESGKMSRRMEVDVREENGFRIYRITADGVPDGEISIPQPAARRLQFPNFPIDRDAGKV